MKEKAKRFSQMLNSNGLQSLDTVYAGDMVCNWEILNEVKILKDIDNYKHIQEALFGDKKKMVIALANMYQLSALNYCVKYIINILI